MSIVIIRGPHHVSANALLCNDDDAGLFASLTARAGAAGKSIVLRRCGSATELADCLCAARASDTEMVLLDPGDLPHDDCRRAAPALRDALDHLDAPYIEVYDDCDNALEPQVMPNNGPMATLVMHDDLARSFAMAMSIALQRLCAMDMARADPTTGLAA